MVLFGARLHLNRYLHKAAFMLKSPMLKNRYSPIIVCALFAGSLFFNSAGYARPFPGRVIQLPLQKIAPGTGQILIDFKLPENHEFTKEAPSTIFMRTKHPQILKTPHLKPVSLDITQLPVVVAYTANKGETIAVIDARVHFCDDVLKICLSDFIRIKFPLQVESGPSSQLRIRIPLKSKTDA